MGDEQYFEISDEHIILLKLTSEELETLYYAVDVTEDITAEPELEEKLGQLYRKLRTIRDRVHGQPS